MVDLVKRFWRSNLLGITDGFFVLWIPRGVCELLNENEADFAPEVRKKKKKNRKRNHKFLFFCFLFFFFETQNEKNKMQSDETMSDEESYLLPRSDTNVVKSDSRADETKEEYENNNPDESPSSVRGY